MMKQLRLFRKVSREQLRSHLEILKKSVNDSGDQQPLFD